MCKYIYCSPIDGHSSCFHFFFYQKQCCNEYTYMRLKVHMCKSFAG